MATFSCHAGLPETLNQNVVLLYSLTRLTVRYITIIATSWHKVLYIRISCFHAIIIISVGILEFKEIECLCNVPWSTVVGLVKPNYLRFVQYYNKILECRCSALLANNVPHPTYLVNQESALLGLSVIDHK